MHEPYAKYEDKPPDKWNDFFNSLKNGNMRVLTTREESKVIKPESIIVEQIRSKLGGQLVEVDGLVGDKHMAIAICELPNENWVLVAHGEKQN